jgi:hypothetical protein
MDALAARYVEIYEEITSATEPTAAWRLRASLLRRRLARMMT